MRLGAVPDQDIDMGIFNGLTWIPTESASMRPADETRGFRTIELSRHPGDGISSRDWRGSDLKAPEAPLLAYKPKQR
jgi:hypothetical protein